MILLTSLEGALLRAHRGQEIDWPGLVQGRALAWITCAAFVPPLYLLSARLPIGIARWWITVPAHAAASVAASLGKYVLLVSMTRALDPGTSIDFLAQLRAGFLGELMFYWSVIGLVHAIIFYRRGTPRRDAGSCDIGQRPSLQQGARSRLLRLGEGATSETLDTDHIFLISAEGNYILIRCQDRDLMVRHTLGALETKLPEGFVRVHRSAIVNSAKVSSVKPLGQSRWKLFLIDGTSVTSGRAYKENLRKLLDSSA
jgi:hypothetical protein